MSQMTDEPEQRWVPAGNGYELRLDGTTLVCRDDQGRRCEPIPQRVLESRAYPAWALIHTPGDAEAALGVVSRLERASHEKPSDAASTYEWIARSLPAPHLPVFWEHAARALVAAGDVKRAAVAFGRAREAEKEHALPVEEAVWVASYLEFAAAGALSAKAAGGFAAGLRDRVEPERALEMLVELAVLRTQNGSPPWPELARQLTALAKAAGRDATTQQQRLIERLVPLPAIRQAPFALWKAWRPALVALAKSAPEVRGRLLDLFPVTDDIDGWWLELLDESTALSALAGDDPTGPEPLDGPAGWLTRAYVHPQRVHRNHVGRSLPRQLTALIPRMSARLAADGIPVRLDGPDRWDGPHGWDRFLPVIKVQVLEACLAHGVPVSDPTAEASLGLRYWMDERAPDEDIPALAADPRFAPLLREALERYRDKDDLTRVPALRPLLQATGESVRRAAGETPRHPLDDNGVCRALYGLTDGWSLDATGTLQGVRLTGGLLDGSLHPSGLDADWSPAGGMAWPPLIGRIGAVALRAAAASTRAWRRERLLALLEVWAETPFAGTGARLRVGIAETERTIAGGEHGMAVAVGWAGEGRRRFVDLSTGDGDLPALGPVVEVADVSWGWGGADRLRHLVSLVRDRGPMPWDPEAVSTLAERTGLSRAAATLILAGVPGRSGYNPPFLDADERKILRIKAAEAEDACAELGGLTTEQRLDLLADVLPDDPAELWEPGGLCAVAERTAEQWATMFGRKVTVSAETLAAARAFSTRMSAADMCAALAEPSAIPVLTTDLDTWIENRGDWYGCRAVGDGPEIWTFYQYLTALTFAVRWAYAELPADDPVRSGAPDVVELLRERLNHPGLLLDAGSPPYDRRTTEDLHRWFGDKPYQGPESLGVDSVDDGLTIATADTDRRGDPDPSLFFRPAILSDDARSQALLAALSYKSPDMKAVELLRSDGCTRMMERIRAKQLPEGTYETNPLASVPDLVAEVSERLDLDPDPAALYLQLLTLLRPTDRNVRTWNGWKPTRHKAAIAALTEGGLVVEGKRTRAGRGVFLPGAWAKADKPHLPVEAWKAELYGLSLSFDADHIWGDFLLDRPLPELYAAAWRRVLDGDRPR